MNQPENQPTYVNYNSNTRVTQAVKQHSPPPSDLDSPPIQDTLISIKSNARFFIPT